MSQNQNEENIQSDQLPLLPLRDIVIFPGMMVPLFVGRPKSIAALDAAMEGNKQILLVTQKDSGVDEPGASDIYPVGCVAEISQTLKLSDGAVKALVEGKYRACIDHIDTEGLFLNARLTPPSPDETGTIDAATEAMHKTARLFFERYAKGAQGFPSEMADAILAESDAGLFSDLVAANLGNRIEERQELLSVIDIRQRLDLLVERLQSEMEIQQIEKKVRSRVKQQMEKSQRDYYLNEQMKAIQKELGRTGEGDKTEFEELEGKIGAAKMPAVVERKALKELGKLEAMSHMSAEGGVIRNYLDWLVEVPWKKRSRDKLDIREAGVALDEDHFGLEKVKDRIIEYLAVRALSKKIKGPVLCFVGPPGVGKTSLGRSIAKAMGRKFVRFSLGGIRDEAEIRGHRRTYVGALPGRIIQAMKRAGVRNPVIMLDEIDKVGSDYRGDPSSALLEALDPEQNFAFNDHYLEVDYDLSEVLFITTANALHTIPRPLLDRMEVIEISGYTDDEKEHIAKKFLIPKQAEEHGLPCKGVAISDKAILKIIRSYTRESGVRGLERRIGGLFRKVARSVAEKKQLDNSLKSTKPVRRKITEKNLVDYLGQIKYRNETAESEHECGVVTGLAWSEVGGSILKIEVTQLEGKGKFILTGKLGDVMKESAQAALSYVRSRRTLLGLPKGFHEKVDIHIHIPEGAIPKDGPSAGVAMVAALVSALTKIPARADVAMTGEVTLRGRVLPIGGLKEKLLAASRAGIKKVLIPTENSRELNEIPDKIKKSLTVVMVDSVDDAISHALVCSVGKKNKRPANIAAKRKRVRPAVRGNVDETIYSKEGKNRNA